MGPLPRDVTGVVDQSTNAHDAHWMLAVVFVGLLLGHVGGVLTYRPRGLPMRRMGIGQSTTRADRSHSMR
jgi:hypothetical protein